jgi:hypothetical protein
LKLNDTHQLLVNADVVNILDSSIHTVEKNTESLVVTNQEIGLEVNAETTKYMVMFRDQKARGSRNTKIDKEFLCSGGTDQMYNKFYASKF